MSLERPRELIIKNAILKNYDQADFASLRPYLEPVVLKKRDLLQEPRRPINNVYFIESGLVSSVTHTLGNMIETATVGRHGVIGAAVVLGAKVSMQQSTVLIAGSALKIAADDIHRVMIEHPLIREGLLHYVHAVIGESSQRTLCAVHHELERRLACWLSIACDTLGSNVLSVTHEHLSVILGVRRAGITEALIRFEKEGLIEKSRGVIQIRERAKLKQRACSCYDIITDSYRENEAVPVSGQFWRFGQHDVRR
jgi:CRP-like cAMP-binding protein